MLRPGIRTASVVALLLAAAVGTAVASGASPTAQPSLAPAIIEPATGELDAFRLGRAVWAWAEGDLHRVVEELGAIDVTPAASFAEADRAAFLLGEALLELGDHAAFLDLAARASTPDGSPWRQWLAWRALALGAPAAAPDDFDGAGLLEAALLLEHDRPAAAIAALESAQVDDDLRALRLHLLARSRLAAGEDAREQLSALARLEADDALGSDLVGGARLALALAELEAGRQPVELLHAVPASSQHRPRALLALALLVADRDPQAARGHLDELLATSGAGSLHRQALLLRGALEMDDAQFAAALQRFERAEQDHLGERAQLDSLAAGTRLDAAWRVWQSGPPAGTTLVPADPAPGAADAITRALDLHRRDAAVRGGLQQQPPREQTIWARYAPDATERSRLADLLARRSAQDVARDRLDQRIAGAREDASRRLRYLQTGSEQTQASLHELDGALGALRLRLAELERTLAAMDSLQAATTARILERTRRVVDELERDRIFLLALEHFHVDGPRTDERSVERAVLRAEAALADELADAARLFGERMPALVDRSFDELLEPRLAGGSRRLLARLTAERDRALSVATALDSISAATGVSPTLFARRDSLALAAEQLAAEERALRASVARQVALRGLAELDLERESLDYHLADAGFERAIEVALDPASSERPEIVRPARQYAVARLDSFLVRHPLSLARAESRFRLADLRLLQARDEFQVRMAGFLGGSPTDAELNDRALAPFVDTAPAVALYRAILAEDPGFGHRDAVLFSLGMILSDDGQAEGIARLEQLVEEYPGSGHAQEAWLRLGDDRFAMKDFDAAIGRLQKAADGPDPSLSAIALYKLGWSHYEQDRFEAAADGFRRLLDLYDQHPGLAQSTDLQDEAEEYLVHSLVRAGGAGSFARSFDALGGRAYEARILASMGALLKSYSLFEESIACDRMWLARYPADPAALDLAGRLVDSYGRDNRADLSREVRLELAPRFMAGGSWYAATPDSALRAEGIAFARAGYREAALHWHQRARESGDAADWARALGHYQTFLVNWPDDPSSPRLHYQAGEAAAGLGDFAGAIEHFSVAADDTASFADDAAWQRVAAADRWYESSGADSLALKVVALGDAWLERDPQREQAADLRWRQALLAWRHGFADAPGRLAEMAARHPADSRVPTGLRLRGDALHRAGALDMAALAYEEALVAANSAGQDSLATTLRAVIPLSHYEHAEAVAAADSGQGERAAAPLFVELARRFPDFEHAPQALYRGGLAYLGSGEVDPAVDAFEEVLRTHGDDALARDAALQIASARKEQGNPVLAAQAWAAFSRRFPEDPDAAPALLEAIDLQVAAADPTAAEELRTEFLERYPEETAAVLEIREARAGAELALVLEGKRSIEALVGDRTSAVAAWLELAAAHPELASPELYAQVEFLRAEALLPAYERARLTQPLDASIQARTALLESVLAAYGRSAAHGVRRTTHAAAFRIGKALIDFGDALLASERPDGLGEDDLLAYEAVLEEQAWGFHDRGEQAWNEMLRQNPVGADDPEGWLALTRESLWPRVARRFLHRPTVDYPLLAAEPPATSAE